MTEVVIAFGANLGDKIATILSASKRIAELPTTQLVRMSSMYASAALKPDGVDYSAPEYVNAVGLYTTSLTAQELLKEIALIEQESGRVRHERWGDRTLDLDIIWMEGVQLTSDHLTIPHLRAHERSFVIVPWAEIQPDAHLEEVGPLQALAKTMADDVTIIDDTAKVQS